MRILPVTSLAIDEAIDILRQGGLVVHATETCYGLTCDLTNPHAVRKIFDCKIRPYTQPISALFTSVEQANQYVDFSDEALKLASQHLPGPLTLVLPLKPDAHPTLFVSATQESSQKDSTIGVRISSYPLARQLVEKFGKPIATTSANVHGLANPYSAQEVEKQFLKNEHQPDLIVDSGIIPLVQPSTVVEVRDGEIIILRQGSTKV